MKPVEVNLEDPRCPFAKWMFWLHAKRCSMMIMEFDYDVGELLSLAHDSSGRLSTRKRISERQSQAFADALGIMPEQGSCAVTLRCQGETREMTGEITMMQSRRMELDFSGPAFWDIWMWMDRVIPLHRAAKLAAEFEAQTASAPKQTSKSRGRL